MASGDRVDPYRNFNFRVEIDGITQAAFSDVTLGGTTVAPVEYREGTDRPTVRKLPGPTKYDNIVLKWGLTDSRDLYNWYADVTKGKVVRKNGSIVLADLDGTEKLRWNFVQGWPTSFKMPELTGKGTDAAIASLEIAHEGMEQVKPA
jgi:phage tail-like protein